MTDYEYHPLWEVLPDGVRNIDPGELQISEQLRSVLREWSAAYDATLRREDPASSGFASPEQERAFEETGMRLWEALRVELGGNAEVSYFSQLQGRELSK